MGMLSKDDGIAVCSLPALRREDHWERSFYYVNLDMVVRCTANRIE